MKKNIIFPAFSAGAMTARERAAGRYLRDHAGHPALTKEFTDAVEGKLAALNKDVKDALQQVGFLKSVKEQVDELVQKMAEGGVGGDPSAKGPSWGEQFTGAKAEELGEMAGQSGRRVDMQFKATITSATTDSAGSVGGLIVPHRDGLIGLPQRRLTIRNLLNVVNVGSNSVEYPKVSARTNNAAPVAEAAAKPQSDLQVVLETAPIRTIAHWMKASRQVLDDVPQLRSLIDTELLYGLALKEEGQLLLGDGVGQNLEGMVPQATAYAPSITPGGMNMLDVLGLAIMQCALTNVMPDGIVIHPSDWWYMRTMKDDTGAYILGNPQAEVRPSLFGLPVVPTEAQTARKFLVGSFGSQTVYDRWQARVETGYVNDDFTKNLVTVLGEERVGFAAKRPEALIYGDFDTALAL